MDRLNKLSSFGLQPLILILLLTLIVIVASILQPGFLSYFHMTMILYGNSILGILALAQTMCILSGGLDLSIGSTYWVTIMAGAMLMKNHGFLFPMIVCILLGGVIGLINGIGISKLKIPHVVMTLAMMIFLTGILYVTTGGGGKGRAAEALIIFSTKRILGFPVIAMIWVALTLILYFIINNTCFGWKVRALGSNARTCYCSGINVDSVQMLVYFISGILAAIAGLLYLGWARTPYPTFQSGAGVGADITLKSIAAVIIGGTLFSGGRGGVLRTLLGVLVLAFLFSILSMVGLKLEWQMILNGIIILLVVGIHGRFSSE